MLDTIETFSTLSCLINRTSTWLGSPFLHLRRRCEHHSSDRRCQYGPVSNLSRVCFFQLSTCAEAKHKMEVLESTRVEMGRNPAICQCARMSGGRLFVVRSHGILTSHPGNAPARMKNGVHIVLCQGFPHVPTRGTKLLHVSCSVL